MLASKRRIELRSRSKWMSCFVGLADSTVFEVDFTPQSDGLEILTKVCGLLGIVETDYFGLTYQNGRKGNDLWLNLRNRVCQEVPGSQPYRLEFRVKFYVPAHMILQQATRHLFYLDVCESFLTGKLRVTDHQLTAQIASLIAYVETSDGKRVTGQQVYKDWLSVNTQWHTDCEMTSLISAELMKLNGMSKVGAEYRLIQTVDSLAMYGACYHTARNSAGVSVNIAVTSAGIVFFCENWKQLSSMQYSAIQRVTNDGSSLLLEVVSDDGSVSRQQLKLASRQVANALYRAMTENYYFYHCDTVGRTVMLQSSRDLKGTLASLFNENTEMGKSYVFDIQRTMREAYDKARRLLFESSSNSRCHDNTSPSLTCKSSCSDVISDAVPMTTSLSSTGHRDDCSSTCTCFLELRESIVRCRDSIQCQICADADVDTAFVPCGHVMCCCSCAPRLDECPLCKTVITRRLKIFLPCQHLHAATPQ